MPEELQQIEDWLPIKEISVEAVRKGGLWLGILRSTNCTCGRGGVRWLQPGGGGCGAVGCWL